MFIPLLCFLTIIPYTHLQHPRLVEATKTQTNNGFSIDLIHRHYSPKSPFYNSSLSPKQLFHRLVLSSASRYREIIWQQNKVVYDPETNLIPNQGDYLTKLSIGTPPMDLYAVVVTGSDLTWFQCQPSCILCYQQNTTMFDPEASSTYQTLPCDAQHCKNLDSTHINCDQNENLCRYWYTYGNGSITQGVMGNDSFHFTSLDVETRQFDFSSIAFGCGYQQSGQFDMDSTGVLGLGIGPVSLVSQLGPSIAYKFSYCLAYGASNHVTKLVFGLGIGFLEDELGGILTVPLVTNNDLSPFYILGLNGISVGETSLNINREIIIDMGTTFTYLDPTIFYNLEAMVSNAIGANPVSNDSIAKDILCYDTSTASLLTPPDIIIHFLGGDLILKSDDIFFTLDTYLCLSIAKSSRDGDPMVFGNMAQVNYLIQFDLLSKTVSFAPQACSGQEN